MTKYRSIINKMTDYETVSKDTVVIFKYLIKMKEISDVSDDIKCILERLDREELGDQEKIKELEVIEDLKEELEGLTEEIEHLGVKFENTSMKKFEIRLNHNNDISKQECLQPDLINTLIFELPVSKKTLRFKCLKKLPDLNFV